MGLPVAPLIDAVYTIFANATAEEGSLYGKLGRSWMLDVYPDDSTIEAKGIYDRVPEGTIPAYIVLDTVTFENPAPVFGTKAIYDLDMTIFVVDGKVNSRDTAELGGLVFDLLYHTTISVSGFSFISGALDGGLYRDTHENIDTYFFEMHLKVKLEG